MWQFIEKFFYQYICAIILMLGVYYFAKFAIGDKYKISKKKFFFTLQMIYIIQAILYLILTATTKTILMLAINVFFCKKVFKISLKKSILLMFMYIVTLLVIETIAIFPLTNLLSKTFCYETFAGSIICNILICMIFLTIIYVLRKSVQKVTNNEIGTNTQIVTLSVMTLISILLFFYTMIKEYRFTNDIIVYIIAMLVIIIILISLIKQTIQNNKLMHEYDNLLEFMTTYENEIEKQRILRHEVKNEFRTIRAKICDQQENKEIIEYIDEIVNDKYEVKQEQYAKFGYLPANGMKGLCYFKVQEAEKNEIKVSLNISKKVKNSTIYNLNTKQQRDFGRILGVFLDNAIEASSNSEEKKLGIEAYTNSNKEFKMIISNTYNNKIDKAKIGIESFSTKGKNRGHGLLLAKQLVGKNDIFAIKTDIQDNIYIQTIEIKKL